MNGIDLLSSQYTDNRMDNQTASLLVEKNQSFQNVLSNVTSNLSSETQSVDGMNDMEQTEAKSISSENDEEIEDLETEVDLDELNDAIGIINPDQIDHEYGLGQESVKESTDEHSVVLNGEAGVNDSKSLNNEAIALNTVSIADSIMPDSKKSEKASLIQEIHALKEKLEQILNALKAGESPTTKGSETLKLLSELSDLEKLVRRINQTVLGEDQLDFDEESKSSNELQQLLKNFSKRSTLTKKSGYQNIAQVTTGDVAKWLQSIMAEADSSSVNGSLNEQNANVSNAAPLSRIEQHIIHLSIGQTESTNNEDFMKQFNTALNKSNFILAGGNKPQFTISLNPHNLGNLVVQMTEIDGEVVVKLIVSSAAARHALESNLHQLKHMFSPHQVVIERQDSSVIPTEETQSQENLDSETDDHFEEENEFQFEQNDKQESFEKALQDYLNTEEVGD